MRKRPYEMKLEAKQLLQRNPALRTQAIIYLLISSVLIGLINSALTAPITSQVNAIMDNMLATLQILGNLTPEMMERIAESLLDIQMQPVLWLAQLVNFALSLAAGVFFFGLLLSIRSAIHGEPIEARGITNGFAHTGRVIFTNFLVALFTGLWTLLGVIVLTLLLFIFIMVFASGGSDALEIAFSLLGIVWIGIIAFAVYMIWVELKYFFALFALAENPSMSAMNAIRESKQRMRGHRWEAFTFMFSFFGWALLVGLVEYIVIMVTSAFLPSTASTLLASIAALPLSAWLLLYQYTSYTLYYRNLAGLDSQPPQDDIIIPPSSADDSTGGNYYGGSGFDI